MTARKKYQVFISSTFEDLREERAAVTWALLKRRHIPVGMEAFAATDDRGWQTVKAAIDTSDYYVLLIAGKLGSVDPKTGRSWTEREYGYGKDRPVPVLAFVRSDRHITADQLETDPERKAALAKFKKAVEANHHCEYWSSREDLVSRVITALSNQIEDDVNAERERPGWFRGDNLPVSRAVQDRLARLTSEKEQLRRRLDELVRGRPHLELWDESGVLPSTVRYTRPCLVGGTDQEFADAVNRRYWFSFSLHNGGARAARNVQVSFHILPAEDLTFGEVGHSAPGAGRELFDRTRFVHVDPDAALAGEEGRSLVQRVRQVNPGSSERLVPFAVIADGAFVGKDQSFMMRVSASDESGAKLSSEFTLQVACAEEETITAGKDAVVQRNLRRV